MSLPTCSKSAYSFDGTNLRGNFSYVNIAGFFGYEPPTVTDIAFISVLQLFRPHTEVRVNLYSAFNAASFLALIDTTPEIDGRSVDNDPDALMYRIMRPMNHYGYRSSDVRAGWIEWRDVPYHDQEPAAHQDSDLLNQVAFNFHIIRGIGTVDNDGWVTFYFEFFLDGQGRLGAYVDGWAYQFGGGEGLNDGGEDLNAALSNALPAFVPQLQSFLDTFCVDAGLFAATPHDATGRALFQLFYLLPGNGNIDLGPPDIVSNVPAPGRGTGDKPVDTEVTLALIPQQADLRTGNITTPRSYVTDLDHSLRAQGWHLQHATGSSPGRLTATRESNGRTFEMTIDVTESSKPVKGSAILKRPGSLRA